jgi:comEA protein
VTFNRNEQIAILALSAALLVGTAVTVADMWWPDAVDEFEVRKGVVPVPVDSADIPSTPIPPVPVPSPPVEAAANAEAVRQGGSSASGALVNVNTASQAALEALPRIGPATARRIVAHRETHGPFRLPEDLMKVQGIGPKTFEGLRDRVTVGSP